MLEIGCGYGYAAAVVSGIAGQVYMIDRIEALVDLARSRFEVLSYNNRPSYR